MTKRSVTPRGCRGLSGLLGAVILTGAVLGSGGCSATVAAPARLDGLAKQLQVPPGYALVYVIRPEFMGQAVRFDVMVNGTWIGATGGFRYVFTYLRPGHYLFQSRAENVASLRLSVYPGRVYFLEQRPRMGVFMAQNDLVLLPEELGRRRLRICALSAVMPRQVLAYVGVLGQDGATAAAAGGGGAHGGAPGAPHAGSATNGGASPGAAPAREPPTAERGASLPGQPSPGQPPPAKAPGAPPADTEAF